MIQAEQPCAATAGSIAGGFVLVPVAGLMAAWKACRGGPPGVGGFRAWLACHELRARRGRPDPGRVPSCSVAELAGLLGVTARTARAAAGRLEAAGLLAWDRGVPAFPEPETAPPPVPEVRDSIGGGRGSLAIPRRLLRTLVHGARPALIAAALGILLRCLSRRRAGFDGRGKIKAAWIARAFGIEPRRVKEARAELVALGWITPEDSGQWSMNRSGRAYRIDLGWAPPARARAGRRLAPPRARAGRRLAPPESDRDPLREGKNQEPAPGGPAGVRLAARGSEASGSPSSSPAVAPPAAPIAAPPAPAPTPGPAPGAPGPGASPRPRMDDVRVEDLRDTGRLLELLGQAVARGLVTAGESGRLKLVAAAEHALAIGRGNPPGLFAYLVRGGLWRYITQADEDRAHARIKAHLAAPPPSRPAIGPPAWAGRSGRDPDDAEVVRSVRAAAIGAGIYRDPFPEFARLNPGWSRERWDRAWGGTVPGG